MNFLTIKFPQKKEYAEMYRNKILDLLKINKRNVRILLKPKYSNKHWWDIGSVIETDLLNLIIHDKKIIYVFNDKDCKNLYSKLYCDSFGKLQINYLDKHFYYKYDFNNQESITQLYRLILGSPYYYFIISYDNITQENFQEL